MEKVFVTGAAGFIGSHLTEALIRDGLMVKALVQYNSLGSWGWLEECDADVRSHVEVVMGDVRDFVGLKKAMEGCDTVFHLAALIGIPYSYVAPESYVETNVKGTLNVVQAARELGIAKVVHTSTSEVYGTACCVPITEEHPLRAQSPYAASKIGADQIAMSYHLSFGLPVAIVRPFNTYGPRQSARAIVPSIITQIVRGQRTVVLGSVHPTRDLSYVSDTVNGIIAAGRSGACLGQTINLGSNFEISVGELAKLIATTMSCTVEIETDPVRVRPPESEVERLWADNTRAKKLLDWSPAFAGIDGLRRGLKATADWFSAPGRLERYKPHLYNV